MLAYAIQRIAEYEDCGGMRIKEWLHAKLVARAKQAAARAIPNGKSEITEQVLDAVFTPDAIGAQQQFDIGGAALDVFAASRQLRDEVVLCIHARIRHDPHSAVEREWLLFVLGLPCRPEQCVAKSDIAVYPDPLCVRAAESHEFCHACEQTAVNRGAIEVKDARNSAHRA